MSTLKDDLEAALKEFEGHYPNTEDLAGAVGAEFVVEYAIVNETRWGNIVDDVLGRGDDLVRLRYEVASGDEDCEYRPEFRDVRPVEVTIAKYVTV